MISIMCSLKDFQTFFTQFFPLYTLYLFFMLSNDNIVDTKKPDEIIHLLLLWINFQDYFCIHHSFLLNIQDCINNKWRFIRFSVLIKFRKNISVPSEGVTTLQKSLLSHAILCFKFFGS